jgi:hypothetical protein
MKASSPLHFLTLPAGEVMHIQGFGRVPRRVCDVVECSDRLLCRACSAQSPLSSVPRCLRGSPRPGWLRFYRWLDNEDVQALGGWLVFGIVLAVIAWLLPAVVRAIVEGVL